MKARLKAPHGAKLERHEIKKESAVGLGRETDQFALCLWRGRIVDVLQVRRLAAQARTVVNDLAIDLARGVIDKSHN